MSGDVVVAAVVAPGTGAAGAGGFAGGGVGTGGGGATTDGGGGFGAGTSFTVGGNAFGLPTGSVNRTEARPEMFSINIQI